MLRLKVIIFTCIFAVLLGVTSVIKNQTRIVEKKIQKSEKKLAEIKRDLHETQLDYSYLSSPAYLSKKIEYLAFIEYVPMDFSKIYLSYLDFINAQKKITILKKKNDKNKKK